MKVIGAGLGRTGTLSIKIALEQLGLGPCYHMDNVFSSAEELSKWQAIADGQPADWDVVFKGFQSTVDWPGTLYWRELAETYSDAKVLLSVRPADLWWESFSNTVRKLIAARETAKDQQGRSILEYASRIIEEQTFGGSMHDREAVLAIYRQRIEDVKRSIPAERLLVFNVADGWVPMCRFLGMPVPATEFPRTNNTEEFWEHFGATVL